MSLPIDEASAKVRTGPPIDDEDDYGLPVWAGILPLNLVAAEPVADPRLGAGVCRSLLHQELPRTWPCILSRESFGPAPGLARIAGNLSRQRPLENGQVRKSRAWTPRDGGPLSIDGPTAFIYDSAHRTVSCS